MQQLADSVTVVRQGTEQQAVVVIDNFIAEPDRLLTDACSKNFTTIGPYYPGIRAAANPAYLAEVSELLENVLRDVFEINSGACINECNYSLVTTVPGSLQTIQRLPHFDSTDPGRIALLHYLSRPEQGGTNFFRHRATGFETITADRFEQYREVLHQETASDGQPAAEYFSGSTQRFEQIASHEAVFNRAIIYRGLSLHSGAIPKVFSGSADPRIGRLTVNTFLTAKS